MLARPPPFLFPKPVLAVAPQCAHQIHAAVTPVAWQHCVGVRSAIANPVAVQALWLQPAVAVRSEAECDICLTGHAAAFPHALHGACQTLAAWPA